MAPDFMRLYCIFHQFENNTVDNPVIYIMF